MQLLCFLSWFCILLDARISLVPIVFTNNVRLLSADCFRKGWPLSSPTNKGSVVALPLLFANGVILQNHCCLCLLQALATGNSCYFPHTFLVLFLISLQLTLLDSSLLFLLIWKVWSWELTVPLHHFPCLALPCCSLGPRGLVCPASPVFALPGAAFKQHLNKKLSSLISSLLLCHWAGDRVPISFTRTPGHKTLGLFLTSNQGALIKETVTSFMSLLA